MISKNVINYRPKRSFGQGNIFTSVCHSFCSRGGGVWSRGVPPNFRGGLPIFRGVSKFSGGFLQIFGGVSIFSGGGGSPPEYGQRSAGTHPTGMHSCVFKVFSQPHNMLENVRVPTSMVS